MKVSLNSVKQLTSVDVPIDTLVTMINQRLGKVEKTTDLSPRYSGAVIVKVESCYKHENADKLNVCMVDDGSGELMQVVCGAPNVRVGMFAVWLKPGSVVPSTFEDKEPFVLGARELRGVMSNGMLASPKELGLGDSHDGILELDLTEWKPNDTEIKPGVLFAEVYGLNDISIDIENKMFTHRPDLFGLLGVAREIAGIQHASFTSPEWYKNHEIEINVDDAEMHDLHVFNEAGEKVPRFMAVTITGVTVKPSPVWLQTELVRLGGKPINNIVDATNYIMLLTAQPTHAYDYDKLHGHTLGARMANDEESITLLNGKTYRLTTDDIVIADANGPVGLGGVMGGGESEVSANTSTIVLEVANFDMYTVRKSSMRHGVFTDALARFNKGQSPLQNAVVLRKLVTLINDIAGGAVASQAYDLHGDLQTERRFFIAPSFVNARLGLELEKVQIETLLRNVEFEICSACDDERHSAEVVHYAVPYWRTDIELPEDIVEEVGRLYGFERLDRTLPMRTIKPAAANAMRTMQQAVRTKLSSMGANEILTYSFVHEKLLTRAGQDASHAYKLSNALSPDLQYYRLGLTPSLLDKVHMNSKAGYDDFALFELGKVHYKGEMEATEPTVPNEDSHAALIIVRKNKKTGAAYFDARRYLEEIVDVREIPLTPMAGYDTSDDEWGQQLVSAYDPGRSALLIQDGQIWGVVGEYTAGVRKAFKLPTHTAGFEIHQNLLKTNQKKYLPLSRFPSVTQDVSVRAEGATYADVFAALESVTAQQAEHLNITLTPTAIYQPEDSAEITTTLRIVVTSYQATLTTGEVKRIVDAIDSEVKQRFNGRVI